MFIHSSDARIFHKIPSNQIFIANFKISFYEVTVFCTSRYSFKLPCTQIWKKKHSFYLFVSGSCHYSLKLRLHIRQNVRLRIRLVCTTYFSFWKIHTHILRKTITHCASFYALRTLKNGSPHCIRSEYAASMNRLLVVSLRYVGLLSRIHKLGRNAKVLLLCGFIIYNTTLTSEQC